MATPVDPTPRQGSWVKAPAHDGPWTPQPRQGSWVKAPGHTGPWEPQPRQGSWVKMAPVSFRRSAYHHIGLVRGARGVG